jgi:dTDP-4-amino-4,6-dideoxygalactose transaminase
MVKNVIAYNKPLIEEDEIEEVVDTLRSGWLTFGPKTIRFEELIADYVGAEHAIAVNSCTAALHLSLLALDIGEGDEVITTPYTFAATGNVILHCGARPVFVDIERTSYNLDPDSIIEAITPRTRAILPVHFAGHPCDMRTIGEISADHELFVVEDAAHAIGSEYDGKKIGTHGTSVCFSFYATKNLTTGEGGAVTTNDRGFADRIRIMRTHGLSRDAWKRYTSAGNWYYEIEQCGWKYNMTDIQASLGIHQIKKIDRFTSIRREYAETYTRILEDQPDCILPQEESHVKHSFHLYPLILKNYDRNRFIQEMEQRGVGCSVHFIPLHLHPLYKRLLGDQRGKFPNAEWIYEREVSLPLYPAMTPDSVEYTANAVRDILENCPD